jgi:nucleotide-binding universal stress UspA family protein
MGWSRTTGLRARLFGNVIDSVFWSSHCPVIVTRLLNSPTTIQRILVPVGDLTLQTIRAIRFAQIVADVNQAEVVLLHVCDRRTPREQVAIFESQLFEIASFRNLQLNTNIRTISADDVAKIIIREAKAFDIVILRSTRYRTAGGLAVSEVTTEVIGELNCSMVLLGEPHS